MLIFKHKFARHHDGDAFLALGAVVEWGVWLCLQCGTSYFTSIKGSARPVVHQFSYKECVRRRVRVSKHNRVRGDPSGTHVEVDTDVLSTRHDCSEFELFVRAELAKNF